MDGPGVSRAYTCSQTPSALAHQRASASESRLKPFDVLTRLASIHTSLLREFGPDAARGRALDDTTRSMGRGGGSWRLHLPLWQEWEARWLGQRALSANEGRCNHESEFDALGQRDKAADESRSWSRDEA